MFYKRLCDQWECEADDAIAELERQQGRAFSEKEKAVFRKRGEHRFTIPDGSRWGDVKAASTNLGEVLTKAMRVQSRAPGTSAGTQDASSTIKAKRLTRPYSLHRPRSHPRKGLGVQRRNSSPHRRLWWAQQRGGQGHLDKLSPIRELPLPSCVRSRQVRQRR